MITDLLILGFLLLFGLRGLKTGTVKQLGRWAGLTLGRAAAKPLALILTLAVASRLGFPPVAARVALSGLCFYTLYIVGSLIADLLLGRIARRQRHGRADRAGGFLLGAGSGAVMVFVLLSLLLFFDRPLRSAFGDPPAPLRNSVAVRLVRRHGLFRSAPPAPLDKLRRLVDAARNDDPNLRASLLDESLARALKAGDLSALQEDPRVAALLKDPRIVGPLTDSLDYDYDEK